MRVYRDVLVNDTTVKQAVFDIMESTYTGDDMGMRKITATIQFPTPIDFHVGDYVEIEMQDLVLVAGSNKYGNHEAIEKFYIYTEPQCKKTARPLSVDDAFETTVVFYPRQYELSCIMMRDFIQQGANGSNIIYTGFDNVTFVGGAKALLDRCMECLRQQYHNSQGEGLWTYDLADEMNESINNALEQYQFSFKGNSVMDALLKLNDKEGINTTFFINDRKIWVGYKRPYLCKVDSGGKLENTPLRMMYGKTSHQPIDLDHGGLYEITKTVGEELPLTKLFAYGASRNLNRYYCADRIQSGRFVNKLMLPSFSDDGMTDYVLSEDGVSKYGIVEGSRDFEEIYPSLRYMTYADIRGIKYCIKVRTSGLEGDPTSKIEHMNSLSTYPICRVQCYRVDPVLDSNNNPTGNNKLVEAYPPDDLAVFIHATGKTVKVVLCGGTNAASRQSARDFGHVPTRNGSVIPGACFCVHDDRFNGGSASDRESLFTYDAGSAATTDSDRNMYRIEYVDTFWLTDLYVFTAYNQTSFQRDGYSAWAWPRLNSYSNQPDSLLVNEVVAVEPVVIADTSDNITSGRQQHFDIYLRDLGFAIDEQNDFGEMVFVYSTPLVSVLDNTLAGREFTIDGGNNMNDFQDRVVCAYKDDGSFNDDFMIPGDSGNSGLPAQALQKGAVWRIRLNRNDNDNELSSVGIVIPNTDINMAAGDHIVLLDIYMPDIYIRAAEQRLLREATKYLENNDKGNVGYAIAFDKVRIQQIPQYALQMREGVRLRVVDADLNMTSDNTVRDLLKYNLPAWYNVQLFTDVQSSTTKTVTNTYNYGYKSGTGSYPAKTECIVEYSNNRMKFRIPKSSPTASAITIDRIFYGAQYGTQPQNQSVLSVDDHWLITFDCDNSLWSSIDKCATLEVRVIETVAVTTYTKTHKTSSQYVNAICQDFIDFKAGKYYEVVVEKDSAFWTNNGTVVLYDAQSRPLLYDCDIVLLPSLDAQTYYKPEYTLVASGDRLTYKFHLPEGFNDNHGYYVSLFYHGDGTTDYGKVGMVLVKEQDIDDQGNKVDYVDFLVSHLTIKITDNTRPDNSDTDTFVNGEYKRDRQVAIVPQPIREIQAQITVQTEASAWGQVMSKVEETAIEVDKAQQIYADLVNVARSNYQRILALRSSLFDPDGTCNDLFIQTMMMQVGADSMNFRLVNTYTEPNGAEHNFTIEKESGHGYYTFRVLNEDLLSHYVFTQGAQGGSWRIPAAATDLVQVSNAWPVYYIALKCQKDGIYGQWICSPDQHPVDAEANYWYFNWGILTPDSNGNYTLTETRGNAYMYGDNLICGQISAIGKNSYFDLTHGNFVLGDANGDKLSYIDGKLTIGGIEEGSGIGKTLHDLGLDIDGIEGNISTIQGDITNTNTRIDHLTIGGRNLLRGTAFSAKATDIKNYWNFYNNQNSPSSGQTLNGGSFKTHEDDNSIEAGALQIDIRKNGDVTNRIMLTQTGALGSNIANDEYTFSAFVKAENATTLYFGAGYSNFNPDQDSNQYGSATVTTEYTKITISAKVYGNGDSTSYKIFFLRLVDGQTNVLTFKEVKLERGNRATPWTKAQEDIDAELSVREDIVDGILDDLQDQIDGAIDTWFYAGVPTLQNVPASGWEAIDQAAHNNEEKNKHLGDLYYDKNTGYCYRFLLDGSTYKWTQITDDALAEALRLANQAQETADGKMKFFYSQPVPPYQVGDMWVKEITVTENGSNVTKHEVKYSTVNKAADETFDEADWVSASEYAEHLANAANAAALAAASVANKAQAAVNNVTNDGIITHGTEKQELNREFVAIAGAGYHNSDHQSDTDGSYNKALAEAATYNLDGHISGTTADATYTALTENFGYLRTAMQTVLGVETGTTNIDGSAISTDTYIGAKKPGESQASYDIPNINNKQINVTNFNALWKDYYDAEIALLNKVAALINTDAQSALTQLNNMAADGVLTRQEKQQVRNEWLRIVDEYEDTHNTAVNIYLMSVSTNPVKAMDDAYTALKEMLVGKTTGRDRELIGIIGHEGAVDALEMGKDSTITIATFNQTFLNYYNAQIDVVNAISKVIDERVIGGENLYGKSDPLEFTNSAEGYNTGITLVSGKKYVVSIKNITTFSNFYLAEKVGSTYSYTTIVTNPNFGNEYTKENVVVVIAGNGGVLYLTSKGEGDSSWTNTLVGIMVQQGEKPTEYQRYIAYLTEALQNNETQVAGGLLATSVIMLRHNKATLPAKDYEYNAGMSGLAEDNVLIWGGGTYAEATYAANDANYKKSAGGDPITTLIKKDGSGKIGIFRINEDDIRIVTPNGIIIIDDNEGISVYDSDKVLKTFLTPQTISDVDTAVDNMRKTLINYSHDSGVDGYKYQSIDLDYQNLTKVKMHPISVITPIVSDGFTHLVFDTYVRFSGDYHGLILYPGHSLDVKLTLYAKKGSDYTSLAEKTITLIQYYDSDKPGYCLLECESHMYVDKLLPEGQYDLYLRTSFQVSDSDFPQYKEDLETLQTSLLIGNKDSYVSGSVIDYSVRHSNEIKNNYVGIKADKYTIIGSNGFAAYYTDSKYFKIVNTDSEQQIIMKGLPDSGTGLASGQLWAQNGYLRIS